MCPYLQLWHRLIWWTLVLLHMSGWTGDLQRSLPANRPHWGWQMPPYVVPPHVSLSKYGDCSGMGHDAGSQILGPLSHLAASWPVLLYENINRSSWKVPSSSNLIFLLLLTNGFGQWNTSASVISDRGCWGKHQGSVWRTSSCGEFDKCGGQHGHGHASWVVSPEHIMVSISSQEKVSLKMVHVETVRAGEDEPCRALEAGKKQWYHNYPVD